MEIKIKKFNELTTEELYKILRVRNEVFVVEQTCIYQDGDNKDYNSYHLYVEEGNEVVGYLRIVNKGISYDEISIGRVLVKETHRNKGLSRKIMLEAIKFIEEKLNSTEIRLSGQVYIKGFYGSLGFKQVSEEYLEDDIPHVEMLYKK
ncbi:GNAT family N-acetyltransferase [Clostridium sp. UBA7339]|uniref:GNAT family N-acetyltransferase n=1 Tax=Clostridium sp. UBA7339 TaxID=1946376 RepID=UPI003216AF3B